MREGLLIFLWCIVATSLFNQGGGLAAILQTSGIQQGIGQLLIGAAALVIVAKVVSMFMNKEPREANAE